MRRLLILAVATLAIAGCAPYRFDATLESATFSNTPIASSDAQADRWLNRFGRPYLVVRFRAPEERAWRLEYAEIFPCGAPVDFAGTQVSLTAISRTDAEPMNGEASFEVVFYRGALEPFMELPETGPARLKEQFASDGLCFRAKETNMPIYGESAHFRIDGQLQGPLFDATPG